MTITASICTDIYAIILLFIIMWLAYRNPIGNKYNNKMYISMSLLTIVLLVLEILTVVIGLSNNINLVIPHRIANILGFTLCPAVPFILSKCNNFDKKELKNKYYAIPLYINAIMCIISYWTGWIFYVNDRNQYFRGNLFLIPMIISVFYFVTLMMDIKKSIFDSKNENNKFLILIFFLPMIGAILQIIFKDLLLIWGSTAMSLVLYYIILRELQFRYDAQTGIKNRLAFEKEMEKYIKKSKDAAIVVLDINYLKRINDKYGHKEGDEVIISASKIIQKCFISIGDTFRIGGDEFCVICQETTKELVDAALIELEEQLTEINKERTIKIEMAYGYDFHRKSEDVGIYSIFSSADHAMYDHKAKSKGLCGRRVTD